MPIDSTSKGVQHSLDAATLAHSLLLDNSFLSLSSERSYKGLPKSALVCLGLDP